jgi:hypothetical protein
VGPTAGRKEKSRPLPKQHPCNDVNFELFEIILMYCEARAREGICPVCERLEIYTEFQSLGVHNAVIYSVLYCVI